MSYTIVTIARAEWPASTAALVFAGSEKVDSGRPGRTNCSVHAAQNSSKSCPEHCLALRQSGQQTGHCKLLAACRSAMSALGRKQTGSPTHRTGGVERNCRRSSGSSNFDLIRSAAWATACVRIHSHLHDHRRRSATSLLVARKPRTASVDTIRFEVQLLRKYVAAVRLLFHAHPASSSCPCHGRVKVGLHGLCLYCPPDDPGPERSGFSPAGCRERRD